MPYTQFSDFRGGLDLTAPAYAARPGTLRKANNGHITRAAHFEARKAFVSKYALPAGQTFGLAQAGGNLYTFGSAAAPAMPAGVTYVRCQAPGAPTMVRVLQAELFSGKVYVSALFSDGMIYHFYDGTLVTSWADGKARAWFKVSTGGGTITSVTVGGVEVLGGTVTWTTSDTNTATLIANQINSYTSSPDYIAYTVDQQVWIVSPVGSQYNGNLIITTCTGDMTVSTIVPPTGLAGGEDPGVAFEPGSALRTLKNKMYSVSGPRLHYSSIADPTIWTAIQNGAGYVNLANEIADTEDLVGLAVYYRSLVIFAANAFVIFDVFSDDTQNTLLQSTTGVGLQAARALSSYFNSEVFFLTAVGIRTLQARDSSNYAVVSDPGARIDSLVVDQMASLTTDQLAQSLMLVEPQENRLWVVIGDTIYVYSVFPSEQIACWTTYEPTDSVTGAAISITDAAVVGQQLFVRAGDTIYLYGGDDGDTYDAHTVATLRIPFTPGQMPDANKDLKTVDFGVDGEWKVSVYPEVAKDTQGDLIADISGPTLDQPANDLAGHTRYFAIELVHQKAEYARVASIGVDYDRAEKV